VFTTNEPPQCVLVAITNQEREFLGNRVYLRVQVENKGNATARNVEVYANELRRRRPADNNWDVIKAAEFGPAAHRLSWCPAQGGHPSGKIP
jgi:hypothetical protein